MRILLDLDGVLANFYKVALHRCGAMHLYNNWPKGEWRMQDVLCLSDIEFGRRIDVNTIYDNMPLTPEATSIIAEVHELDPDYHICSAMGMAAKYQAAMTKGKIEWCQRYLGRDFKRIIITDNKAELARSDRLLIDDADHNVESFIEAGGQAILYPRPWNHGNETGDVFGRFRDRLRSIQTCV